jgi:IS5 family transposase
VDKRAENQGRAVQWEVALRPGQRRALPKNRAGRMTERIEQLKARVRALVEHPFHWIKNIFGLKKVRYRGLAKNTAQLYTLFALANLMIAKRWLLVP